MKSLGRLQECEGLCVQKEYDDFLYYKDMSEIAAEKQVEALKATVTAPERGKTSLLISNTGPLLKTFEALIREKRKPMVSSSLMATVWNYSRNC